MAKYYAVALTTTSGGFGEWERSLYGGAYARTIKEAISKATAGEHNPDQHDKYLLGRDDDKLDAAWDKEWGNHGDIRGLIYNEPERVYAVQTIYGIRYVGVEKVYRLKKRSAAQ